jgi:hypothetical protein
MRSAAVTKPPRPLLDLLTLLEKLLLPRGGADRRRLADAAASLDTARRSGTCRAALASCRGDGGRTRGALRRGGGRTSRAVLRARKGRHWAAGRRRTRRGRRPARCTRGRSGTAARRRALCPGCSCCETADHDEGWKHAPHRTLLAKSIPGQLIAAKMFPA